MSENAVLVTILGGSLTMVVGVTTFFLKRWIESVDETLKEHNTVIYKVSTQVSSFQSMQGRTSEDLSQTIRTEIGRNSATTAAGLLEVKQEIEVIKHITHTRILPHMDAVKLQLGKVIVLEKNQDEQGKLINKLYETLKLVIEKSIRPK